MNDQPLERFICAAIFAVAVLHTFSTQYFQARAHRSRHHAGLWHLLGEVEAVFGFWALVMVLWLAFLHGQNAAIDYVQSQNFTEPLFVFAIMTVAATRPILDAVQRGVQVLARHSPCDTRLSGYFLCLGLVPLAGSLITEPAAMTLAALMLQTRLYRHPVSDRLKYFTLGVLFVNVSIGGVLTPYAAPPVLMVAEKWGWDLSFMFSHFGWRAVLAVLINASVAAALARRELRHLPTDVQDVSEAVPWLVTAAHMLFLAGIVIFAHHPVIFVALFLFFLGFTEAYRSYQSRLMLREGLMVGFFLAGLVVLGGKQQWWLQAALADLPATVLYFGATALTAVTDNAALTYLGSLVSGLNAAVKYALVAGAVTGGGLTVIANAPNPAGYALLKSYFAEESIRPLNLFLAALFPTLVAIACFMGI